MPGEELFRQPSHKYKEAVCSEDKAAFLFFDGSR